MAMGMGTAMSMLDMRLVITDCSGKMEVIAKDTALPGNLLTLQQRLYNHTIGWSVIKTGKYGPHEYAQTLSKISVILSHRALTQPYIIYIIYLKVWFWFVALSHH